jgi:hypothetical protein
MFEQSTVVVVAGRKFACVVRAKKEDDAKRIQPACDELAKASPALPASPASPAAGQAAEAAPIELEVKTAPGFGSSIKIPKGAKTLAEDKYTATYSLVLPDKINELNISMNQAGASDLADAKRTATMMGGTVEDAKTLPSGMQEVVLAPQMGVQTVSVSLPKFGAKCSGPTKFLPQLLEMCESLTPPAGAAAAGAKPAPAKAAGTKPAAPAKPGAAAKKKP